MLVTFFLWHSQAVAGFEWIPPKNDPTVQTPTADLKKTQADFSKDKRANRKTSAEASAKSALTPADRLDRIFSYEAARIDSMNAQEAQQKVQKNARQQKAKFLPSNVVTLNKTITKNSGLIPFKTSLNAAARGYASHLPKGQLLSDLSIDSTEKPIVGFGTQVPLALAVSDIVPDQYSFGFEGGVNPGLLVSWEGLYRPWTIVLSEMLAMRGLSAVIDKKQIKIFIDPTKQAPSPMALAGSLYAAPNLPAGAMPINPMPAPQKLSYNSTALKVGSNSPPLQPFKQVVPQTTFRQPGAQTQQSLAISSFPLQSDSTAAHAGSVTMIDPFPQKTQSHEGVYIPRHGQPPESEGTTLEKVSESFDKVTDSLGEASDFIAELPFKIWEEIRPQ